MHFLMMRQHPFLPDPERAMLAAVRRRGSGTMELTVIDTVVLTAPDVRTDRTAQIVRFRYHFASLNRAILGCGITVWRRLDSMDACVLVQKAWCADVVRTVSALVSVLGLRTVVRLVYREQSQLVGSVRTDVASQSLCGNPTRLFLLRCQTVRVFRLRADVSHVL